MTGVNKSIKKSWDIENSSQTYNQDWRLKFYNLSITQNYCFVYDLIRNLFT